MLVPPPRGCLDPTVSHFHSTLLSYWVMSEGNGPIKCISLDVTIPHSEQVTALSCSRVLPDEKINKIPYPVPHLLLRDGRSCCETFCNCFPPSIEISAEEKNSMAALPIHLPRKRYTVLASGILTTPLLRWCCQQKVVNQSPRMPLGDGDLWSSLLELLLYLKLHPNTPCSLSIPMQPLWVPSSLQLWLFLSIY